MKYNTRIRKAVKKDCPAMMELIHELARFEKAAEEVTVSLREFEKAGFSEQAVWEAFVAEHEGRIVGMALFYIRYSTWKGRRLYLEDIIITEDMRGQGIGTQLFDRLWGIVKERQYAGMVWQVLDWNKPAIEFYKKYSTRFEHGWLNVSMEN